MALNEIRERIDKVDGIISDALAERIELSREVARDKAQDSDPAIYRKERENEIIARLTADRDGDAIGVIGNVYRRIMTESRRIQYEYCSEQGALGLPYDGELTVGKPAIKSVVCQGIAGAYSAQAAAKFAPDAQISYARTFEDVFKRVGGGVYGVLPFENSTAGCVTEVSDLLLKYGLYIVAYYDLPIKHALLGVKGARAQDIKTAVSHPQALSQCSEYLYTHGIDSVSAINTAVAAESVAAGGDLSVACVCDASNAERYGLTVIDGDINDSDCNATKFILVSDRLITPERGGRISLIFSVENAVGTLAGVLDIFSAYGVSMCKIESRPSPEERWEYKFYVDLEGNINGTKLRALMYQLYAELPFVKLLGCYCGIEECV